MKRIGIVVLALGLFLGLFACGSGRWGRQSDSELGGRTFVWEKEGFGGDFTITLNKDGTYEYYTGYLSSYIGNGNWTVDNGILILTETGGYDMVFRFRVQPEGLVFQSKGSDAFMSVRVEDGDRFLLQQKD